MSWMFARERNILPLTLGQAIWAVWFGGPFRWRGITLCAWGPVSIISIRDKRRDLQIQMAVGLRGAATPCLGQFFPLASFAQTPGIVNPHFRQAPPLMRSPEHHARNGERAVPRTSDNRCSRHRCRYFLHRRSAGPRRARSAAHDQESWVAFVLVL